MRRAVVAVTCLLLVGCGSPRARDASTTSGTEGTTTDVVTYLRDRAAALDTFRYTRTVADELPSQQVRIDDEPLRHVGPGVVVGHVTDVTEVGAYRQLERGGEQDALDFADADADFRVVVLTIDPDEVFGYPAADQPVRVGMTLPGGSEPTRLVEGLRGLGRVAVVLGTRGFYDDAPDAYTVSGEVELALVRDGRVRFPAMPPDFTGSFDTVDALAAEATAHQDPIVVRDGKVVDPGTD